MPVSGPAIIPDPLSTIQESNNHRNVTLGIWALPFKLKKKRAKVIPLQARCDPEVG